MKSLNQLIEDCEKCPRLREYCLDIAKTKKKAFLSETYWGKPVENFGEAPASLLIVGLAPAAHGANRTGRMFTGDQSGLWLYRALHRAGFATEKMSSHRTDGLKLINTLITAVCHCAPPDNKPSNEEIKNCAPWLLETFKTVDPTCVIALGQLAWNETWKLLRDEKKTTLKTPKFFHGQKIEWTDSKTIIASYHPSQQNTFTGKLTEDMFDKIFTLANSILKNSELEDAK